MLHSLTLCSELFHRPQQLDEFIGIFLTDSAALQKLCPWRRQSFIILAKNVLILIKMIKHQIKRWSVWDRKEHLMRLSSNLSQKSKLVKFFHWEFLHPCLCGFMYINTQFYRNRRGTSSNCSHKVGKSVKNLLVFLRYWEFLSLKLKDKAHLLSNDSIKLPNLHHTVRKVLLAWQPPNEDLSIRRIC